MSFKITCRPDGAGTYQQHLGSSPLYAQVDDVYPDDDSSYIYMGATQTSTFTINISSVPANAIIAGVTVYTRSRQVTGSAGTQAPVIYSSTRGLDLGSTSVPGSSYSTANYTWTDINRSELTNLEIGVKTSSVSGAYEMRCTQVYCEITYSLPSGSGGAQIIGLGL